MKYLKKIYSPTILLISLSLLIYIFYRSEFIWNGGKRDYYFIYYLLSILLIFFSILTFFISQEIKEYLVIISITIFISLYLIETYLTYQSHLSKGKLSKEKLLRAKIYEERTGKKWDKRTLLKVYKDLKKKNNDIVIRVAPKNYIFEDNLIFPLSGISNSETIYCNENATYTIYKSDRYGFNNPDKEWDSQRINYLIVGDSFAHGACVNRPYDITSVLRTLSKNSALNLGYGGNGPLIQYATLREYLDKNVNKILWIYYEGNDLKNFTNEKKNKILSSYLDNLNFSQDLKSNQKKIDQVAYKILQRNEREYQINLEFDLIKFLKISEIRTIIFPIEPIKETSIEEFKKLLKLAKNLSIKNNSEFYFVYLPEYYRYKSDYDNSNYNLVKNVVNELNIKFIDIDKEVFKKEINPLKLFPFELFGHYTKDGYKKVANAIYRLTKN